MTPERIAELRALAEAATPGPWLPFHNEECVEISLTNGICGIVPNCDVTEVPEDWPATAAFIAAARTALPEALDALERVRRACEFDAGAYLDTEWSGGNGKGMPVVPVADILAALEGKK